MTLAPELQSALVAGLRAALPGMCRRCAERVAVRAGISPDWYHYWIDSMGNNCWSRCEASAQRTLLARAEEEATNGR